MNRRTFLGRAGMSAGGLFLRQTLPDYEPVRRYFFMYPRIPAGPQWWVMTFPEVRDLERLSMVGGGFWRLFDAATHRVVGAGWSNSNSFASQSGGWRRPFPQGLILQASREPVAAHFSYPTTLRCGTADLLSFVQDEHEWRGNVGSFVIDQYRQRGTWLAEQPPPAIGSSYIGSGQAALIPEGHVLHDGPRGTVPSWFAGALRSPLPVHDGVNVTIEEYRAWMMGGYSLSL